MIIDVDLNNVPDKRPVIPAAIYNFKILEVSDKAPKPKEDGSPTTPGNNVVLKMEVVNHGDQDGRQITYYCFIPSNAKRADAYTDLKRVFLSAGIQIQNTGMNTNDLLGKVITASVGNSIYNDPKTGVPRETANIGMVYIPADNVKPGQTVPGAVSTEQGASVGDILGGGAPATEQPAPAQETAAAPT